MSRALRHAPLAVAAAAMVATPLRRRGRRAGLANVVIGGLAAATATAAAERWGARRAVTLAAATSVGTLAVERLGTATGVPFGRYAYTGALRPAVGGVPVIVPLAWFALALPAREVAHACLGTRTTPVRRIAGGAALLAGWDLFLDPQMVGEGYWRWARRGRYRGIPLSNYLGWLLTGAAVLAVAERLAPPPPGAPDARLVAVYGLVVGLSTVGFALFFGDRLVAAAGAAATVPPVVLAARRLVRG